MTQPPTTTSQAEEEHTHTYTHGKVTSHNQSDEELSVYVRHYISMTDPLQISRLPGHCIDPVMLSPVQCFDSGFFSPEVPLSRPAEVTTSR